MALFPSVCRWCRNNSGSFRKWRCVDWRGDWWTVEGASHSCYQDPSTVGWGVQHEVPEAVHSQGWSRELLEQAFDDDKNRVQMRNLLVLFHVDSNFYHICATQISPSPTLLPVRFVPPVNRWCPCVSPFARRRKHNCCFPWWIVSISCLDLLQQFSCLVYSIRLYVDRTEWSAGRQKQGPSQSPLRVETSETSGHETDSSKGRRKILFKKTFRMK